MAVRAPHVLDSDRLLHGLVSIPSPTGSEGTASAWLVREMDKLGLKAGVDAAGNAVGIAGSGQREILLLGHIDTVSGQIPVRIEDDVLHGRGAVDAKGALAAFVAAASAFVGRDDARIVVIGAVGEEGDSRGARHVVASNAYRPDAIVVGEPSGGNGVTIGYRGRARALYRVESEVAHTGSAVRAAPDRAIDFIVAARRALAACAQPRFDEHTVATKRFECRSDGLTTSCEIELDIRIPPRSTGHHVAMQLEEAARQAGGGRAILVESEEPVVVDKESFLARAFVDSIRVEGRTPRFVQKTGTSDMNLVAPAFAVPVVAYGPGDSKLDHTPHEALRLSDYAASIRILERVLDALARR